MRLFPTALPPAFAALLVLSGAALAQEKTVSVYNWSNYIDESILADFTKETGIKVVYDVYEANETLETKLLAGKSGYDVVVPSATFLTRQIRAKAHQKLDKSKLPNLSNAWDEIQTRVAAFDPGNEYSVTYMWGTSGLGYNVAEVKKRVPNAPLDSWALLLDPQYASKLEGCGIYVLDSPEDVIPNVLRYLKLDPSSKKQADLDKAAAEFQKIRKFVKKFTSADHIDALANGEVCLVLAYSGDIFQARDRGAEAAKKVEIEYFIPKEGALMWFDQLVIPVDAPHPDEAHAFINYLLKPEVIAKSTNFVKYANGNKPSQAFVDKEILENRSVYPDPETFARLFTVSTPSTAEQRLITRAWTRVKTGR